MKNLLTAVCGFLCFALFSCQKEVEDVFKSSGAGTPGLLKKMVIKQGADSSVTEYFYNSAAKIIAVNISDVSSGSSDFTNERVERNSQGMIQKIITKSSQTSQYGVDSLVAIVSSSSGHYTSRVIKFVVLGDTVTFTSLYFYDVSGKITSQKDYTDDGSGSIDSARMDFVYAGSNLISLKGYNLSTGSPTPDLTQVFEYDSKSSPLVVANEGFVLNNFYQWVSANNIKKITVNVAGDPDTHIETLDYIYNAVNKPLSANVTQDAQTGITANYYYN